MVFIVPELRRDGVCDPNAVGDAAIDDVSVPPIDWVRVRVVCELSDSV